MEYTVYFDRVQIVVDAHNAEEAATVAGLQLADVAIDWRFAQVDVY